MELIAAGVSGLLLLAIWRFALKKAILDAHRDQLFDLRDELRHVFASKGWAMDSQLYRNLRDLINGYLRFTERYSLARYSWIENLVKTKPDLKAVNDSMEAKFMANDVTQQDYIKALRRRALTVMTNYMIFSSGPLLVLTVVLFPFALVFAVGKKLLQVVRRGGASVFNKAIEMHELAATAIDLAAAVLAKRLFRKDFVEEFSFKQC